MAFLGKSPWDDAGRLTWHLVPRLDAQFDIGSPSQRIRNIYVQGSVIGATFDLANNQWLQSLNAAGTSYLKLLKAGPLDNTTLNALTGKSIFFQVNEVTIASLAAAGLTLSAGTVVTAPTYNLSDGSDKNYNLSVYAAGTAYTMTATSAAVTFGTTSPSITLNKAGTYLLLTRVNYEYVGATFAANRTVTTKLRRTNNTAADLTNASTAIGTNIVTTVSGVLANMPLPPTVYTTSNTNDVVTIFADVSVLPSAGSLQITEASITAIRLS